MGILAGSATFERYWITNDPTPELGPDHLGVLEKYCIGGRETSNIEQADVGFLGGGHLLDTRFDLEKNVIGDAMHFGIRIDSNQVPAAIRNAWMQIELAPLIAENASGRATKAQRQEAKEAVEARCIQEAEAGKFKRMQQISVLWDSAQDVLYLGGTSASVNETCLELMERAFGLEFESVTASRLATTYAADRDMLADIHAVNPTAFQGEGVAGVKWWNGMAENFDYLGNEFLLWLWWHFDTKSDTIELADDTEVSFMFARTLTLDCPLGESGKESISSESPVALPEALLALRSGKQPRKAGLTLVRDGQQFDLTLQAEAFSISGAKMIDVGDDSTPDNPAEDRIEKIRAMSETLDLLYFAFCERRIGKGWQRELRKMQEWLQAETIVRRQKKPAA